VHTVQAFICGSLQTYAVIESKLMTMETGKALTREEIVFHIRRLSMRIDGLINTGFDRAIALPPIMDNASISEWSDQLKFAREQKALLEKALAKMDAQY
jgi:hypothetical protein